MNKKILVIFFIGILLSFIIFKVAYKENTKYLALGDELVLGYSPYGTYNKSYVDYFYRYLKSKNNVTLYKEFCSYDKRIQDIIKDIDELKEIKINNKSININQIIAKSDIITISFGQKEIYELLSSNYNKNLKNIDTIYKYIDDYFNDYVLLINKIRRISDSKIYIIGLYNPLINTNQKTIIKLEEIFNYINKKFKSLEENKNIYYVEISKGMDDKNYYVPKVNNPYPSLEGYNYISNVLICKVSKKC